MNLSDSVGSGGRNRTDDIKLVQSLLNDNNVTPKLLIDGLCGEKTISAIRWFQERIVRLCDIDGMIEPNGKSWQSLRKREGDDRVKSAPRPDVLSVDERKEFAEERKKFVDPRVKENKKTTQIIDGILPHFRGSGVKVISGYLADSDLIWKVNYHWEYLIWMVEHSITLPIVNVHKQELGVVRAALLSNKPNPKQGYRTSDVGKPVDSTSAEALIERYKILKQQKETFKKITHAADLISKSQRSPITFHLAAAPVAQPSTSKHSTGYALDIQGPAGSIKSIAKRLGATLIFDEKSHVHVEFKNGVSG